MPGIERGAALAKQDGPAVGSEAGWDGGATRICIYVKYIYGNIYMLICVDIYMRIYICVHVYMYINMYVSVHTKKFSE